MKTALLPFHLLGFSLPFVAGPVSAVTRTWDSGGGTANFSTAANWTPDGVPANNDDLVFPSAAPATVNNDLTGRTFGTLSFPAGVTLAGNPFTLNGGISTSGAGVRANVTIEAHLTLGANQTFTSGGAGSLTFNGNVNFTDKVLTVTGARPCTFNGITGSTAGGSRLIKNGSGLVRFGPTAVAFTNQPCAMSDGTLDVDGSLQATVNLLGGRLTGSGTLTALTATAGDLEPDAGGLSISGNVTLGGSSRCLFHLTGPSTENTLSLGGSTIVIQGEATLVVDAVGHIPLWGEEFQLITKSTAGFIIGSFSNAADNAEIALPGTGTVTRLHYTGGNGNDVTLDTISTTHLWDGDHFLNTNWDQPENWSGDILPHFGDVLLFPRDLPDVDRIVHNNFPNDTTFRQLVFRGDALIDDDFTVRGNRMKLSHGILLDATVVANLDTSVTLAQDQTFDFGRGLQPGTGSRLHLDLLDEINTGGHTLQIKGGIFQSEATLDGKITGAGGVRIPDGSYVVLGRLLHSSNPNNTYTGETVIETNAVLSAEGDESLGSTAGLTRIGGTLRIVAHSQFNGRNVSEPLVILEGGRLESLGWAGSGGASSTNRFTGAIQLQGSGKTMLVGTDAESVPTANHEVAGTVSGTGTLVLEGKWTITGTGNNTHAGTTRVASGPVTLKKTVAGANALSSSEVMMEALVAVEANEQIVDGAHVRLNNKLVLGASVGRQETIGNLTMSVGSEVSGGAGARLVVAGDIVVTDSAGPAALSSRIGVPLTMRGNPSVLDCADGSQTNDLVVVAEVEGAPGGSIRRTGAGRVTFSAGLSVPCELRDGETVFNGVSGSSGIVRLNGGDLTGTGTTGNLVSFADGGRVSPGPPDGATGMLNCRAVSWNGATGLDLRIKTASDFDRLSVQGGVSLGNARLSVTLDNDVPLGSLLVILANDGTDPVVGTFAGFPEGTFIDERPAGWLIISYHGGDGNDITLTRAVGPGVPPKLTTVSFSSVTGAGGFGQMTLSAIASPGTVFGIERSTDLKNWSFLQFLTANSSGLVSTTIDLSPATPNQYFRLPP